MIYMIEEKEKSEIKGLDNSVFINTKDIDKIFTVEGKKSILWDYIKNDKCMSILKASDDILKLLFDSIIEGKDFNTVRRILIQNNIPFFSLVLNDYNKSKKSYEMLNNIKNATMLHIVCNKNNLIKILSLCEKINVEIHLDTTSISLEDYYDILENYDFSKLEDKNIKIFFQKYNRGATPAELYNMSRQINMISKEIKKFNLSPFEQLIFVYDMVKRRYYTKEKDGEDPALSRNLKSVLETKYIVCAGYITLGNAILRSLGHNVLAIRDKKKKHRRGLVYLKDDKYNIDGAYIFDPTFDRKRRNEEIDFFDFVYNDIGEESDDYRYFALPFTIADKSSHIELLEVLTFTFDGIKDMYNASDIEAFTYVIASFETLFSLIDKEKFKELDRGLGEIYNLNISDIKGLEKNYNNFLSKFYVSDIDVNTFIRALYNVKRVQYYLDNDALKAKCETKLDFPTIDKIDIKKIKDSIINRYGYVKSTLERDNTKISKYIATSEYRRQFNKEEGKSLGKIIAPSYSDNSLKRDMLNMKLVKTLKTELNRIDKK